MTTKRRNRWAERLAEIIGGFDADDSHSKKPTVLRWAIRYNASSQAR